MKLEGTLLDETTQLLFGREEQPECAWARFRDAVPRPDKQDARHLPMDTWMHEVTLGQYGRFDNNKGPQRRVVVAKTSYARCPPSLRHKCRYRRGSFISPLLCFAPSLLLPTTSSFLSAFFDNLAYSLPWRMRSLCVVRRGAHYQTLLSYHAPAQQMQSHDFDFSWL